MGASESVSFPPVIFADTMLVGIIRTFRPDEHPNDPIGDTMARTRSCANKMQAPSSFLSLDWGFGQERGRVFLLQLGRGASAGLSLLPGISMLVCQGGVCVDLRRSDFAGIEYGVGRDCA